MVNVSIVGATGYAGEELIDIILRHPQARLVDVSAKIDKPQKISRLFPRFKNRCDLVCAEPDLKKIAKAADLVFLGLPHTVSMDIAPKLLALGKIVIDLSADYRLKDIAQYELHYAAHKDRSNIAQAVYGLPELYRAKIKSAKLIANPGCYPTVSILALAPVVALNFIDPQSIIIDAKSGVTGAGRKLAEGFLFAEANEDFKAYKIDCHQHAPEIDQELSKLAGKKLKVIFVPHLLPLNRGILATIYANKIKSGNQSIIEKYKKFYKGEPFVRIREEGSFPRLKDVCGTNFCDIGIKESKDKLVIVACIDNLLKGAAGQAVENFNIIYKFPEETALL